MNRSVVASVLRTLSGNAPIGRKLAYSRIYLASGMRVLSGPFSGMWYVPQSAGSGYFPKLLGTYEIELQKIIEDIIAREPDLIIDVGAAEGYFAVGLAFRTKNSRVVAYDMDFRACYFCQMLTQGNNLAERVEIRCKAGACEDIANDLERASNPFILMDVEGAERDLLQLDRIPALRKAEILVELHQEGQPDRLSEVIGQRFEKTHAISIVEARERLLSDLPFSPAFLSDDLAHAMFEGREPKQQWMHLRPLADQ